MSVTKDSLEERRAALASRRAALSALKQQELDSLLKKGAAESTPARVITPRPPGEAAPLSFAQERLWFLDQMEPGGGAYNVCLPFRIGGRLNPSALGQSLGEIVRRHESLRTTFPSAGGRPVQAVAPAGRFGLTFANISALPAREREALVLREVAEAGRRPFDLSSGPLLHAALFRLGEEEHVLILLLHHIAFDEWSKRILMRDAGRLYEAFRGGEPSPLPELPVQYADFAHWQREWLRGERLEEELAYWRGQLEDSPPVLGLSADRPRSPGTAARAASAPFVVPEALTGRLKELTDEAGATLFMTLLASFKILLSRYSGQDDLVVGTPVAGRRWVETEELIGFFVNTLALRTKLSGDPSVREVLARVRAVALEAQTHQDLPFEKLVEELQPERSLTHTPLFQVLFGFQNATPEGAAVGGLTVTPLEAGSAAAKFDLTLMTADDGGRIVGSLEYNADLFERSTVERMVRHYLLILEEAAADPARRLSEIELLSDAERRQLLVEWNDTAADFPSDSCLHHLFERQAARSPDAPALTFGDERLTFAQLDASANRLAHHLVALGARPESRVALLLERSPEMVVAILAALKAGAAYLPIDPDYPADRVSFILQDAGASLLVTHKGFADGLPAHAAEVVDLDEDAYQIAACSDRPARVEVAQENLAYVIYTSGSTGRPKGVAVTHRSLVNHMSWMSGRFPLSASDAVLQKTPYTFDASAWEFFAPLLEGARLVVAAPGGHYDPDYLIRAINGEGVAVLQVVPTLLERLVEAEGFGRCESLRRVYCGGEALSPRLVARFSERLPSAELCNLYGPTEATIDATYRVCEAGRDVTPIGRPVSNARAYVLDAHMRLAPAGVAGELYLGGECLARGYLNNPGLTAERFVPDTLSGEAGSRLYRTGDLARWDSAGELEYLGRADRQVKVRGYRIEAGEVEAALLSHSGVREAAVAAREDARGEKRLVAYVVAADGAGAVDAGELREHVRGMLPEYMVPSAFVALEGLPLTSSGKVDRGALPAPEEAALDGGRAYVAPRTPVEELLARVWTTVLGLEEVGVEDNFFLLGGHSLLATQVVSRVREVFDVELPLRTLFERPTVAALARSVEQARRGATGAAPPPLVPADRGAEIPLSFAQQRLWFLDKLEPGGAVYNVSDAVRLRGALDLPALESSLTEIVARHESLRTRFGEVAGRPVQVIDPPRRLKLDAEDLSGLADGAREAELRRLLREEEERPFDLGAGPLLRVRLYRLGEEEHVLAATMHHVISDGWSMGVLTRELGRLYAAHAAGLPAALPELKIQYADYAVWQRGWLRGEVLEEQLSYWRGQLAGAPAALALPADKPRPPRPSHRGAYAPVRFDAETTRLLKELSRRHNTTLFVTLLAGFQALLSRWSGQEDVVVGTVTAGRTRAETEGLIGFFVNALALRTDLSGDPSVAELLRRATDVCLGAYAHQDVPFEKLVEELGVTRDLSRTPLFQVALVLQNTAEQALEMPGLQAGGVGGEVEETGAAKFDLLLSLAERGDELRGSLEYSLDLFEAETIGRMARQLERVLKAACGDESRRVSELPLLSEGERERIVVDWNRPERRYACEGNLVEGFARAARRSPEAVALTFGDERLTYAELDARSNRLANHLVALGARPESRAGLLLERSAEMVVAILAVLKAGAAYVPLEAAAPPERLAFMLEDAGCSLLLTTAESAARLPHQAGATVVALDADADAIDARGDEAPAPTAGPDNAAYVIYTSGSTGRPKGVVVTHANVLRLMSATEAWFSFSPSDVWTMFHSYAFDFSVWELWGALLYGGRLVVVPYWVSRSPDAFYSLLLRERVTVLNQTPSAFRQLMQAEGRLDADGGAESEAAAEAGAELALRVVVFGGEALEPSSLRPWYEGRGESGPLLVNMYGITETTVHVTYRPLSRADAEAGRGSLIGRRIPDLRLYVLDKGMRPVPAGVAGELYVGGGGLARGYLNRPGLTAERFVPDPFSGASGSRLYRTGDLARWDSAGELEYLGRADQQVKVRGFRIETGEVEAALRSHEGVREAAVVAREDGKGDKQLVAYVVAADGAGPSAAELRAHLGALLPDYMTPSSFVALDSLPLTPNGKLDRKALPAPESDGALRAEYVAPRTSAERALAEVWGEVLGAARVGVEDNFFDLGGDSIRSVQVVALARERGLSFSLQQLFEHQTVAGLSGALTPEGADRGPALPTEPFGLITREDRERLPADVEDAYPLSMLQAGMLFHSEFNRDSALYHNYSSFHVRAPFDRQALELAVSRLIARHAVLRTSFDLTGYGTPLQLVHRSVELPLEVEDLGALGEGEQEEVIARWRDEERGRHIDWSRAPLIRFHVHLRGGDTFQFSFAEHHAILDGWSVASMLAELFGAYSSIAGGADVPAEAPPPRSSFRDFVALEQAALASADSERFWREKLSGSSMLTLPRLRGQSGAGEGDAVSHNVRVDVPGELSDGLKRAAQAAGVPVKSVLLAAHLRVLSLVGGREDVLTGLVSHGRPETLDAEQVLGLHLNTLPFRLRLGGGAWAELAREAFEAEREAMPHRYYPMAQVKLNEGGQPLFETTFNFTHFHVYDPIQRQGGVEVLDVSDFAETEFAMLADFSLHAATSNVGLSLSAKGEVLSREQLEAIGGYYLAALSALARDPSGRYEAESLLSERERQRLLVEWNDTAADFPSDSCLHHLFERQAARSPDAIALAFGDERLTFAQLDASANRLAHHLVALGARPESRVALLLERSPEMVVAILAALKAGAAYLPVDPDNPRARTSLILRDAGASLLLTHKGFADDLPAHPAAVVRLDSDADIIAARPDAPPRVAVAPESVAYVLYTSGSTGKPKGVAVAHRSLVNHMSWMGRRFPLSDSDAVLQKTPYTFDASAWEFFAPLLEGARLVMAAPGGHYDPDYLIGAIAREGVTVLQVVPTLLERLVEAEGFGAYASLRRVYCGGEALSPRLVTRFSERLPDVELCNLYGPTEATIDATYRVCEAGREVTPIGKPVSNARAYVLDARMRLAPAGVAGELYLGGECLARGYLNNPGLTAERFVPDTLSGEAGSRLYRTGDLARWDSAGELEYLGRADRQVKVRGYRIEAGEVEAALLSHSDVREAAVAAREDARGEKRLVAYVVAADGGAVDAGELREHVRGMLPEYMVPSAFVALEGLPLTSSGKVDRGALPTPEEAALDGGRAYVAPRTPVEELLARVWEHVLGRERVGRDDNFFLLGGHSLLAMQIVARVRDSFRIELPVRTVFDSPTLAELSTRVETAMRSGMSLETAPPILRLSDGEQSPLSYGQQRLWFLDRLTPGGNAYNLPAELPLDGDLDASALAQALSEVVRRHEALRTTFALHGDEPTQLIHPPAPVPLPLVDLSALAEPDRLAATRRLRDESALRPFDLSAGPLLRAALLRLGEGRHLFLLCMHHAVSDGWSTAVLLSEMRTLYSEFRSGRPSPLEELSVQYADYARWQRGWLQGEALANEVSYWKRKLDGAPTLLELETDRPRRQARAAGGAQAPVVFTPGLSRSLREFGRREGATLFMTLMAGFQALLHRYTGQEEVLVGTPVAGRGRVELEPLVGFFVNMIAVRGGFGGRPSFRELVRQVRGTSLEAYAHQELPFDKLVEELQPRRAPGRNPIFQAILALTEAVEGDPSGEVFTPAGVPASADAKFDLELHLRDTAEGLAGSLVYSPELFDDASVARMAEHFTRLLERALEAPDAELSTLPLLGEGERRRLVEEWNDTESPIPDLCLHEEFERQAALRPDAVALEFEGGHITYDGLNRRANVLAHELRRLGVGPDTFVGVMLERSADLVVSLLAVSKAGGAYVPVNLADPAARIRYVLVDADVRALLTNERIAKELGDGGPAVVCVDAEAHNDPPPESEVTPAPLATAENIAYMMYTSGSTGEPKGVCVTHRNVLGLVKGADYAHLGPAEVFMQFAPASFDASTFEVWGCLLNGGRLVVFPPGMPSLRELGEFVNRAQITTLFLTTGLFHQYVDTNVTGAGAVRQLLTGGDTLSPAHVNKAAEQMEGCLIVNCYGPTEATVMVCCYQVAPDRPASSVPIGRPISNARVYVVSGSQPAGVGERGELYIGGAGLARGYHNRPDLTAERFLPDPFGARPGGRLYRTGDAARHLNQGLVQFLGRVDNQVKISGFRIEPGEVEAALSQHPSVGDVTVLAREDTPGDKRLVAYVVARAAEAAPDGAARAGDEEFTPPTAEELRAHLKDRVPEYALPSAFVMLDAMPLTANGKIDRGALPAPQLSLSRSGREYVAPRNGLQQQLVDIWEELFKVHPIGLTDNFFELGGHSLMMIMLVARVEERLGKRVTMADLFADPTVEHLSKLIGHGKENPFQSLVIPMQPEGGAPAFFAPHASGGHVWCYKDLVRHVGDGQPFYGIQAREPEGGLVVHTDIVAMASDYVEAIRSRQPQGPYFLGGWSMGGVIAFEMARQLQQQGERIGMLALMDSQAPDGRGAQYVWTMLLSIFAFDLGLTHETLSKPMEELSGLPPMTQLRQVWIEAKHNGLIPKDMTLVEFRKVFDIYKINANTMNSYTPGTYEGRITLFRAEEDDQRIIFSKDPELLALMEKDALLNDPFKGWGKLAAGGIDLHVVPGGHFSMMREPHAEVLAGRLRACVMEALGALGD
jgi:amino acid adenylation domain-containing protein